MHIPIDLNASSGSAGKQPGQPPYALVTIFGQLLSLSVSPCCTAHIPILVVKHGPFSDFSQLLVLKYSSFSPAKSQPIWLVNVANCRISRSSSARGPSFRSPWRPSGDAGSWRNGAVQPGTSVQRDEMGAKRWRPKELLGNLVT